MNIRKCDKCKKKLSEYQSKEGIYLSVSGAIPEYMITVDLCNSCAPSILKTVRTFAKVKPKKRQYGQ